MSIALAACGGGGGGDSSPPVVVTPKLEYPVLSTATDFNLPTLAAPPDRPAAAGVQRGQALGAGNAGVPAGLTVELLDATTPAAPRVLATGSTSAGGTFALAGAATGVAPADLWLRVTLADGTTMRAWASDWTEITPGSEVAVREIARLRNGGAFASRALNSAELSAAQQSLGLLWLGRAPDATVPVGIANVLKFVQTQAAWNALLERMAANTPATGAGDIAGLMPLATATWPSSIVSNGSNSSSDFVASCFGSGDVRSCSIATTSQPDLTDLYDVQATGIRLRPDGASNDAVSALLTQLGPLPLIEFPFLVGTRVLMDNPRLVLGVDSNFRASVKVTRRTYPVNAVQALGGTVQAVRVVLDYEIAVLNYTTQKQIDLLAREQRWFSPSGGRVRIESTALARADGQIVPDKTSVVANAVVGEFLAGPTLPYAGVASVRALALRYRHAIFVASSNRVYVGTASGGGQLLELDADTLATLRTAALPGVPGRLAASADGTRLYAGMDGGQVAEVNLATMALTSQFKLPADPYGVAYDRVYDLAVDPFDSARVLLIAGSSGVFGNSGAVLLYQAGVLVQRDAPRYYASDYGWGYYSPYAIAWTAVANEFLTESYNSPGNMYRFRTGAGAATDVSGLERVEDHGLGEAGGEILTRGGKLLDSGTFSTLRRLGIGSLAVQACNRQSAQLALCQPNTGYAMTPPYLALLDAVSGDFLGGYRPLVTQVSNGCPEQGVREGSLGLDLATLRPMDARRSLVAAIPVGNGELCSLQVWSLNGVVN